MHTDFLTTLGWGQFTPEYRGQYHRNLQGIEQETALALGEIKKGQVTRKDHKKTSKHYFVHTEGPTSNKINKFHPTKEQQIVDSLYKMIKERGQKNGNPCIGCDGSARPPVLPVNTNNFSN